LPKFPGKGGKEIRPIYYRKKRGSEKKGKGRTARSLVIEVVGREGGRKGRSVAFFFNICLRGEEGKKAKNLSLYSNTAMGKRKGGGEKREGTFSLFIAEGEGKPKFRGKKGSIIPI